MKAGDLFTTFNNSFSRHLPALFWYNHVMYSRTITREADVARVDDFFKHILL